MGLNYFVYAGRRSTDYGLYLRSAPKRAKPARQIEIVSIPGRNGRLRIDKGAYENTTVVYDCFFSGGPEQASAIANWLYDAGAGYLELRDTYHPGVFCCAAFDGPFDAEDILSQLGIVSLTFDCKPQLWTDAGQQPVEFKLPISADNWSFDRAAVGLLYNPYPFVAKPLIRIEGYANQLITVKNAAGESHLSCKTGPYAEIDCDLQNMYWDDINENTGLDVSTDFPVLAPGENIIIMSRYDLQAPSGSIYTPRLIITPRWWHL